MSRISQSRDREISAQGDLLMFNPCISVSVCSADVIRA